MRSEVLCSPKVIYMNKFQYMGYESVSHLICLQYTKLPEESCILVLVDSIES